MLMGMTSVILVDYNHIAHDKIGRCLATCRWKSTRTVVSCNPKFSGRRRADCFRNMFVYKWNRKRSYGYQSVVVWQECKILSVACHTISSTDESSFYFMLFTEASDKCNSIYYGYLSPMVLLD